MHHDNLDLIVERVEHANSLNESLHICSQGLTELIDSVRRDPHLGSLGLGATGFANVRIKELQELEKHLYAKRPDLCDHCTSYVRSETSDWIHVTKVTLMAGEESISDEIEILRVLENGSWVQHVPVELPLPERIEIAKEELAVLLETCGRWVFYWRDRGRNCVFDEILMCNCL